MSSNDTSGPAVWIWTEPIVQCLTNVISQVKDAIGNKDLVQLHLSKEYAIPGSQSLAEFVLNLCQQFNLLENERTTFFSNNDHLLALELCISRLMQKTNEVSQKVEKDKVKSCHSLYAKKCLSTEKDCFTDDDESSAVLSYEEFLKHCNCVDIWCLHALLAKVARPSDENWEKFKEKKLFLVLGPIESMITRSLLKIISGDNQIFALSVESPLNSSFDKSNSDMKKEITQPVSFEKHLKTLDDIEISPRNSSDNCSATEEYAEEIILAFLNLIVNCRNELALSKAIISPLVDLGHQAFTDIKHASLQKEMPMCQTVLSYVTRMKLGGKGYAPPADCPLKQHLKGLEQFVDLLNQLQTLIEEDSSTESAVKRAINILKNKLIRCSSNKLRKSSIEEVAKRLTEVVLEIVKINGELFNAKKSSQIGHQAFSALYQLVNQRSYSQGISDFEESLKENDADKTPLNLPPLLGYFRSPEEEDSRTNDSQMTAQSLNTQNTNDSVSVTYFHSNDSCSNQKSCLEAKTPTRLTFRGIFQDESQGTSSNSNGMEKILKKPTVAKPGAKRAILGDISHEKAAKRVASAKNKKSASKSSKQKPQIKGQGQITNFFFRT